MKIKKFVRGGVIALLPFFMLKISIFIIKVMTSHKVNNSGIIRHGMDAKYDSSISYVSKDIK